MASPLFLLRIDNLGLEIFLKHKREFTRVAVFSNGEYGAFADWVHGQPRRTRFRVLVDLADESFEAEELPRTRGADRRALISRRLSSYYPQPAYASAESLGCDRNANTELLLFSGLGRPARLDAWMAAVSDGKLETELLISPARLIAHFVPGLNSTISPPTAAGAPLLVANFTRAGMRVSLIEARSARLSRLVEGFDAHAVLDDDRWRTELERTLHYASSRQTSSTAAAPNLVVIAAASLLPVPPVASDSGCARTHHLDPVALGGHQAGTPPSDSTALLLHWLARAPRRIGWPGPSPSASAAARHLHALALGAGAIVLVGGIAIAGHQWQAAAAARAASSTLHKEILGLQRERAEFEASHAQLDAPPAQIIDMSKQMERQLAAVISPLAILRPLADALDRTPEFSLRTLSWSASTPVTTAEDEPQLLARIELTLRPKKPHQADGHAAIDALVSQLQAGGARDIEFSADRDGHTRLALRLPLIRLEEPLQ